MKKKKKKNKPNRTNVVDDYFPFANGRCNSVTIEVKIFFFFNKTTLNNRSKIFLKMAATVYEKNNCVVDTA